LLAPTSPRTVFPFLSIFAVNSFLTLSCCCLFVFVKNKYREEKAAEVEAFFKEHPYPPGDRTIKQSLESIRASLKWLSRDREGVEKWLAQHHSA